MVTVCAPVSRRRRQQQQQFARVGLGEPGNGLGIPLQQYRQRVRWMTRGGLHQRCSSIAPAGVTLSPPNTLHNIATFFCARRWLPGRSVCVHGVLTVVTAVDC